MENIKTIQENSLKEILKDYFKIFLLDIDQTITAEKFDHLVNRTYDILIKYHSALTLPELENVLQTGMNEGFGSFKKLTVQTVREWFYSRQKEIYQKRHSNEVLRKNKREDVENQKKIYTSPLGRIVLLKFNMMWASC